MRQIAAEVGVQAGALYNYTPDKQTLLFDMMKEHMEALFAAWEAEGVSGDPLAAFTRFHIRFHLARPDEVFIAYMELRNLEPGHFSEIEALRRAYEGVLEGILREGTEAGVFAVPDPRIASMAVIAMLTGVNTWYRPEGRLGEAEVADLYGQMVRAMVASPESGPDLGGV